MAIHYSGTAPLLLDTLRPSIHFNHEIFYKNSAKLTYKPFVEPGVRLKKIASVAHICDFFS